MSLKRTVAIFFLLIFLFNAGGYYAVFWAFHYQAEKNLMQRLDAERYTAEEEVILSIPISLPYPIHQSNYEKTRGEFEYNGENYKLVKQKLEGDTLFLVCVRNVQQNKLELAMSDYSKVANDMPTQSKQTLNLLSKLFKDFQSGAHISVGDNTEIVLHLTDAEKTFSLLHQDYPVVSPPPKVQS
jgi:hypothetical protein